MELPDTTWYSHVFTNHIEVSKVGCLQWHVSSIELNMQLRDILNHLKPTAEAAASTSVFVHLILGQNTYMCFTTLGALPKHFFGFDIPSRSGQPQLSNLTGKKKVRPEYPNLMINRSSCRFAKVEQPGSSLLRHAPWYVHLLTNCGPCFFRRTWMGLYGAKSCKATQLFGSSRGAYPNGCSHTTCGSNKTSWVWVNLKDHNFVRVLNNIDT